MTMKRQRPNWKEVELPLLETALTTDRAKELTRNEMPVWAQTVPAVSAAWLYYEGGAPLDSTGSLSTGDVHVHLDVERQHDESPRFRYDRYLFVKMRDGRAFQLGPDKDVEYGHHHVTRPDWIDKYRSG
jgi:hypothetical protein